MFLFCFVSLSNWKKAEAFLKLFFEAIQHSNKEYVLA